MRFNPGVFEEYGVCIAPSETRAISL
uniref:Uncharacterized protein n=1 Tax=Anguilla anguilla TaxID=7936 RepID=A0A0E9RQ47_ANGAN